MIRNELIKKCSMDILKRIAVIDGKRPPEDCVLGFISDSFELLDPSGRGGRSAVIVTDGIDSDGKPIRIFIPYFIFERVNTLLENDKEVFKQEGGHA